jgi:undecaprenyl-diphosphatase
MVPTPTHQVHRSLPGSLRQPSAVAASAAVLVLAALGWRYADGNSSRWLDVRIQSAVDGAVAGRHLPWSLLLDIGEPLEVVSVTVLLASVAMLLGRRRLALLAFAGPGLTGVATTALKPLVGRLRGGGLAYPSGHAGLATAFGLVAALLVISVVKPGRSGACLVLAIGAVTTGGAMAVALVVSGWHYPTDTIGGFATAVAVVLGVALLVDRAAERRGAQSGGALSTPP